MSSASLGGGFGGVSQLSKKIIRDKFSLDGLHVFNNNPVWDWRVPINTTILEIGVRADNQRTGGSLTIDFYANDDIDPFSSLSLGAAFPKHAELTQSKSLKPDDIITVKATDNSFSPTPNRIFFSLVTR